MWTIIIIISFILLILGIIGAVVGIEEDEMGIGMLGSSVLIFSMVLIALVCTIDCANIRDVMPLLGHIDHDKTVIKEQNNEPTALYLTIDGKEYHIILQEGEQENE